MNILLIEDDKLTLRVLKKSIENLGDKVFVAENGEEAINIVSGGKFDLLICDIMMPGISGLSLVTILRSVHLCTTPIVMMSTLDNRHLQEAVYEAGANGFLAKPFSIKGLEEVIIKFDTKLTGA